MMHTVFQDVMRLRLRVLPALPVPHRIMVFHRHLLDYHNVKMP